MKNLIWIIVILIIAAGVILEYRYSLVINSPIVAKMDRLTGDVWIVNSGIWRKVQPPTENINIQEIAVTTAGAVTESK